MRFAPFRGVMPRATLISTQEDTFPLAFNDFPPFTSAGFTGRLWLWLKNLVLSPTGPLLVRVDSCTTMEAFVMVRPISSGE